MRGLIRDFAGYSIGEAECDAPLTTALVCREKPSTTRVLEVILMGKAMIPGDT